MADQDDSELAETKENLREEKLRKHEQEIAALWGLVHALLAESTLTNKQLQDTFKGRAQAQVGGVEGGEALSLAGPLITATEAQREGNRRKREA